MLRPENLPNIWETLDRIRLTLDIDHQEMAEIMKLTRKQYIQYRNKNIEPSISAAMSLSEKLNVGFEELILNRIDYRAMSRLYQGDSNHIPEKFLIGASGKARSISVILDYVDRILGWEKRVMLMRKFQLTENALNHLDQPINIRLAAEMFESISAFSQDKNIVEKIGQYAAFNAKNNLLTNLLSPARNASDVYEMMIPGGINSKYFEKNYHWSLMKLSRSTCTIRGYPNDEVLASVGKKYITSALCCEYRLGIVAAFPAFARLANSNAIQTACIAYGDNYCEFEVYFSKEVRSENIH